MQVAHEYKVPLIVDNTFGMGGSSSSVPAVVQATLMRNYQVI